jgi:hypothetical protein
MGAIQVVSCRRRQYRWDVAMRLYNADYKAMGVQEELMHSGSWRTRLLNPAVAGGGGRGNLSSVRVLGFTTAARTLHGRARCAGGL